MKSAAGVVLCEQASRIRRDHLRRYFHCAHRDYREIVACGLGSRVGWTVRWDACVFGDKGPNAMTRRRALTDKVAV